MDEPCTTAICGMPAADSRAWLAKLRPPSTKISAWYIRLAPPDSTSAISGSLFSRAISCARSAFFSPIGGTVPPLTPLSLAEISTRLPDHVPMPTMEPPPARPSCRRRRACRGRRAAQLEEARAAVEQPGDALARQQLAALLEFRAIEARLDHRPSRRALRPGARPCAARWRRRRRRRVSRRESSTGIRRCLSAPRAARRGGSRRTAPTCRGRALGNSGLPSDAPPSICSVTPVMKAAPG